MCMCTFKPLCKATPRRLARTGGGHFTPPLALNFRTRMNSIGN